MHSLDANNVVNRRKFVKITGQVTSSILMASSMRSAYLKRRTEKPNSKIDGVQIGVITYSYRSMSDQSIEAILQYVLDSGINAIELMGDPVEAFAGKPGAPFDQLTLRKSRRRQREGNLTTQEAQEMKEMEVAMSAYHQEVARWRKQATMEPFLKVKQMYAAAGVQIYGFKPRALGVGNSNQEVAYACRAASALGASHLTVELPGDDRQTARLGKIAKKYKMPIAYHGHLQQTPTSWDVPLKQNAYNAMNPDLGHYVAAGNSDPIALLEVNHHRIKSIHLKDRKTPEHGRDNMPWGMGDTPLKEILRHMRSKAYPFPATIELEYPIPSSSDAVKEVGRCLDFCRDALS